MSRFPVSVETAYQQRTQLVLIALTGRTGVGCTTTASILKKPFDELDLTTPKAKEYSDVDERKYAITYNYIKNAHWQPFTVIEGSSIIFSFVIEKSFEKLIDFFQQLRESNGSNIVRIEAYDDVLNRLHGIKNIFGLQEKCNLDDIDTILKEESLVDNYYKWYIESIPKLKKDFENILKPHSCYKEYIDHFAETKSKKANLYTFFMQQVGNNIRSSGDPYSSIYTEKNFYCVADRIDKVIKIIQKYNEYNNPDKDAQVNTRVCIDAIRNPYEAFYFRDKYSSFYLVSVNTDENTRRRRLGFLDSEAIESLDDTEFPSKMSNEADIFYHQNIPGCLEISDIHLYNPQETNGKFYFLTKQIIKYISLMIHPGLVTPSNIERCMQLAYNAKLNSGCLSRQVGAVITDQNYSVKAVGWNDVPAGQVPCNLRDICNYCQNKDIDTYSEFEIEDQAFSSALNAINNKISISSLSGRTFSYCFKDVFNSLKGDKNQVYTRSLHAEENSFLQLSKYGGVGIQGGFLFTTASPCELCSKKAYQLGIQDIYYIDPYPGISFSHILKFGTLHNPNLHLFHGAIGSAYVSLYTQRIPIKDEIQLLTGISGKKAKDYMDDIDFKRLGVQDIEYISRDITLSFETRETIHITESIKVKARKDNISMIPIAAYWSGTSFGPPVIDNSPNTHTKAHYTEHPDQSKLIGYASLTPPLKKDETCEYVIKTDLRDVAHVMSPYLSQFIPVLTKKLTLCVKAKNDVLEKVVKCFFADEEMSAEKRVTESDIEPSIEGEYKVYTYVEENPNLNCTYCIGWRFVINSTDT